MEKFEFKSNRPFIVTVDDQNITIEAKGLTNTINRGIKGVKTIPINAITAIQYKKPGFTTGFMQFAYSGSSENKGGIMDAVKDENTILFGKKETEKAEQLKALIESKRHQQPKGNAQSSSAVDEIKQFKSLLDDGIITQEEFDAKKKQLLGI